MKKEIWLLGVLGFIFLALLSILIFVQPPEKNNEVVEKQGLQILSPKENEEISSPVKIIGTINGNGWAGFEGQVGTVQLLDGNGKELSNGILGATTDWMILPTNFETELNFAPSETETGLLIFKNENASGLEEKNKTFSLPVKFSKTEIIKIKTYFLNNNLDPEISCNKVFPTERWISKTQAVAKTAIEELLKGVNFKEMMSGYYTNINIGVKMQSLVIENDVAKIDFNYKLEDGVGGSCAASAIKAQIEQTLKQFSTIKEVVISINGQSGDTILQP